MKTHGIICKDKNIEKYALENYGRLSGTTTIGIIITALSEYASQRDTEPKEGKGAEEILKDFLDNNEAQDAEITGGQTYLSLPDVIILMKRASLPANKPVTDEEIRDKGFIRAKGIKGKVNRASFYDGYICGMKEYRELNKNK